MGQNFFPDAVNRTPQLSPSLHEWLPEGHLVRFLLDAVASLGLSAIHASCADKDGRGPAARAPETTVRPLL
jgi:hypothetical protein